MAYSAIAIVDDEQRPGMGSPHLRHVCSLGRYNKQMPHICSHVEHNRRENEGTPHLGDIVEIEGIFFHVFLVRVPEEH